MKLNVSSSDQGVMRSVAGVGGYIFTLKSSKRLVQIDKTKEYKETWDILKSQREAKASRACGAQ